MADPANLERLAHLSGLRVPAVARVPVDTGIRAPADLVAWRLGSRATAPFVAALSSREARELTADALEALGPAPQPLVLGVRVLSSRASATLRSVPA